MQGEPDNVRFIPYLCSRITPTAMIGRDDGWKILIGIVPWYCEDASNRERLYWLKDGLPSIPRKGDWFYMSNDCESFLEQQFGEKPCEGCIRQKYHVCPEYCYGYFTSDFNVVYDVAYDTEDKVIIIMLTDNHCIDHWPEPEPELPPEALEELKHWEITEMFNRIIRRKPEDD